VNRWRVVWYDGDDHEVAYEDFRHESEARRRRERWLAEGPGSTVKLFEYRFDAEPVAEGTPRGRFVPVSDLSRDPMSGAGG
jgi:hypothetical protein